MTKSKLVAALVLILGVLSLVPPNVFSAPSWRGEPGTTLQQWSFSEPNHGPVAPDDGGAGNTFGMPFLWVGDRSTPSDGAWMLLTDQIDIIIPNATQFQPLKEMWIELTWKEADQCFLPKLPFVAVVPLYEEKTLYSVDSSLLNDQDAGGGWTRTTFTVDIRLNPPAEWIVIKGDIYVDQVVVDTWCVPEPATLVLLALAGLLGFRRKRTCEGLSSKLGANTMRSKVRAQRYRTNIN